MKVVITAQGNELSSEVDLRFGRAQYLIVMDTETGDFQAHSNTVNLNAAQGAGIQTGRNVAEFGVEALITGNVGPNAFRTLSAAGVKVFLSEKQTVADRKEQKAKGDAQNRQEQRQHQILLVQNQIDLIEQLKP